jgi:hypothetical protein
VSRVVLAPHDVAQLVGEQHRFPSQAAPLDERAPLDRDLAVVEHVLAHDARGDGAAGAGEAALDHQRGERGSVLALQLDHARIEPHPVVVVVVTVRAGDLLRVGHLEADIHLAVDVGGVRHVHFMLEELPDRGLAAGAHARLGGVERDQVQTRDRRLAGWRCEKARHAVLRFLFLPLEERRRGYQIEGLEVLRKALFEPLHLVPALRRR